MLWVQRVEILYTKLSRGAPAATRRNRLPRGFAITDPRAGDYYFESYKLWESTGFVPERAAAEAAPVAPLTAHALSIRIEGDAAILGLVWSSEVGAPPRKTRLNACRSTPDNGRVS